ncbi:MAG: SDR family NAD(P)-dependent oxidoreductase [Bacteroidales bacterium]|nr:SDR family NAD(P)-dependent oxidoreductase [Bacteroidales bacterium]
MKTVLITGATSGIGKATATTFASNGYRLILTGRRQTQLSSLAGTLKRKYNTESLCLCFDISDYGQSKNACRKLKGKWDKIDVLINNAGLALGLADIIDGKLEDWEQMIDTNIKGLLYITKMIIPFMVKAVSGHIVNIGSIAGRDTYPQGNVYCATKFAVKSLSQALRMELIQYNIKVTEIVPGAVKTEFSLVRFKGDKKKADRVYDGYEPLKPKEVADIIHYVTTLPPNVNINELTVTSLAQANPFVLLRNKK